MRFPSSRRSKDGDILKSCATAFLALLAALWSSVAEARLPEVESALPGAERVGTASYRVLAWPLFDADLWAIGGAFSWERPFALALTYRRHFRARDLTNQTLTEMSRRGAGEVRALAPLGVLLNGCFRDVAPSDRITGLSLGPDTAKFFVNGVQRCELRWPGFRRRFFGIWLDGRGGDRALSARLRGASE